jgi:hypothetical protein
MQMLRLNTRHALPQTEIDIRRGHYDATAAVPARVHTESNFSKSNKGVTQPSIDLDNYPSRKSWGARNLTDLTREFGQKGLSDVRSGTSRRTQIAWSRAENGGKPGNDIKQQVWNEMMGREPETLVQFDLMDGPRISVTPSRVVGESDIGDVTAEIQPAEKANISYTPGSVQTYLKDKGFIRRWVTMNEYDIYA